MSQKGLTIVELTIVIAIISVLSVGLITLINIPVQLQKARDTQRKSDILSIKSYLETYRFDQRTYPPTNAVACGLALSAGGSTYMTKIPCEVKTGGWQGYLYNQTGGGTGFTLTACLERATDPQANGAVCGTGGTGKQFEVRNP